MTATPEVFDDSCIPHTDFDAMLKIAVDRIAVCKKKDSEYGALSLKCGS